MSEFCRSKCKAPFNNMYFTVHGNVAPCWLQVGYLEKWSKTKSISDIWFGEKYNQIRQDLENDVYKNKCLTCKKDMDDNVWPLAKAYDQFPVNKYPSLIEIELSNQCNLECIMCSGELSSGIRKNREKLPPLPQVYDDSFNEQLREFIPHLEELRINGGEPFAQKLVLDLCDIVAEIKPDLKVNIATNGTVYNKRVQHILDNNNIHINISIDSLIKQRYEEIRINGDFDVLMDNVKTFHRYVKANNRKLCIMVNPMRNNWDEMMDFVAFCDNLNVDLWYNTIRYPAHLAIWNLESDKLLEIYNTLNDRLLAYPTRSYNWTVADHLINKQIKTWLLDSYTGET